MKNVLSKVALAALATAATAGVAHAQSTSPSHSTSWTGTVGEDRYGDARFKMRGRFQYDILSGDFSLDDGSINEDASRSYARRAFLGVQGRLSEHWRYKVDFILTPSAGDIGVDDAYLEYAADDWSIIIGESNITSPLEDRISSLDIPFVERSSMINAFEYGRRAGVAFIWGGANWHWSAAVQGDSLNTPESGFANDESTAISTRFTFAPIFSTTPEGTTLLHLGVHARQRDAGDDATSQIRTRPFNGRGSRGISAGSAGANRFDTDVSYGGEVALQFGPFGAQAEYAIMDGDTPGGASYQYDGGYVDLYWSITGESRPYRGNQGSFGAIAPRRPVTEGGPGHLMLSARYDTLDLSDSPDTQAGEQTAYGIGLDWVPIDHVRFKLNYAHSDIDRDDLGEDGEADIISLRTQFDF